jgi:tyrosine-specific transport protein
MTPFTTRLHGILLVAGTSIGGGMLALPVLTGQVGFFPSLTVYFFCWLFMASTGLLFLEITLWMRKDVNIVTMAGQTLGKWGKVTAWCLYLFLFYCLTLAYIVGAGDLIVDVFHNWITLKEWQGQILFLTLFGPLVCIGAWIIGRLNPLLMLGLAISYLVFVVMGMPYVSNNLLLEMKWSKIWIAFPITFTAFAYQGTVPTLVSYMNRNPVHIRQAILIGSFLPFIAYAIWQWLILGIVPAEGPGSLQEAISQGQNAVQPLKNILNVSGVYIAGQYFAFFALITSFFGVTLGLLDFLADGLNIKKTVKGKLFLCLLIFIPPFFFAFFYPHLFLIALEFAGGIGCALLLGLLPILMVWSGRYRLGFKGEYQVSGGKPFLCVLILFVAIELICEFFVRTRIITG